MLCRRIGPFLFTNAGYRHCRFCCISSICWVYFSVVMISPGFRKLQLIRWAADHQTVTMTFFWCKFGFGKCFGASQSNHWAGHCWLSCKTHFLLYITIRSRNGSSLLCRIKEDDTSEWFFWFLVNSWGTHLPSFFTFPVCFKCHVTVEWVTLTSWATSCVVVRGSATMMALGCHQLPMADYRAPYLQGSCFLCKISWTTAALYIH